MNDLPNDISLNCKLFADDTSLFSVVSHIHTSATILSQQSWTKGWMQFTKLSKIGFSMECFTAEFLQLFNKKRENLTFGWTAGYSPLNSNISGILLKLTNFLRS